MKKEEKELMIMNLILNNAPNEISVNDAKELLNFLDLDHSTNVLIREIMIEELTKKAKDFALEMEWDYLESLEELEQLQKKR